MSADPAARRGRAAGVLTAIALAVVLLSTLFALAVDVVVARGGREFLLDTGWSGVLPGLALAIPGALLFRRMPRHSIAVTLLGFGVLWCLDGAASSWVNLAFAVDQRLPGLELAAWYFNRFGAVLTLPFLLLLLLFPTGRLPERRWLRVVAWISIAGGLFTPLYALFVPPDAQGIFDNGAPRPAEQALDTLWIRTPLPLTFWEAIGGLAPYCLVTAAGGALLVLVSRRFGADPARRRQLRWLIWSSVVLVIQGVLTQTLLDGWIVSVLFTASLCLVCASVVVAITRYRLYAIDRLFSWTVVYATLIGAILLVDAGLVTLVGSAIGEQSSALLAVLLVGLAFAPLRNRLLRVAGRIVAGHRVDPAGVVTRLAARLEVARGLPAQLEAIAEAVADAFASPSVEVRVERVGVPLAAALYGSALPRTLELPLEYRGVPIGRITLAPGRRPRMSARDQRLLGVVIRQAASAASAAEATDELRRIRRELVLAREAERLRLRRDLHDGLGPLVASIRLRLETAGNLLESDPGRASELLSGAASDAEEAVGDVRRIVDDLRPPALDDLGVAGAIRAQAERFHAGSGRVSTSVELSGALPAAVEIAAYRIVSEALANAARHSGASRVEVEVEGTAAGVRLRISDDGSGMPETLRPGTGLHSQRERAEELGGTWSIGPGAAGGTEVVAWLPARAAEEQREKEMADVG
ncbi:sensor histidine kinase [Naasia aerilata]|uniref:histidine kinase n=1 Tax=Naasia aerilata TaxID=1162966 RepID=A0ABN6XLV7_9MICO|nr:sensor histidine kinase [Naasia aerilata]BDZ45864.1 hypothetical protein GCM10025866_17730 [Naasia aerilata]